MLYNIITVIIYIYSTFKSLDKKMKSCNTFFKWSIPKYENTNPITIAYYLLVYD